MADIKLTIIVISKDDIIGFRRTMKSLSFPVPENIEIVLVVADKNNAYWPYLDSVQYSHLLYNEDNGLYDAMNRGIECSSGAYVNFLNGGDCFHNEFNLESFVSKLNGDLCCFNVLGTKGIIGPGLQGVRPHQGIFYKKEIIKRNPFDSAFKIHGDMDHWYRLKRTLSLKIIVHDMIYAHFEGGGISEQMRLTSAYELFKIGVRHKSFKRILSALNRLI